ncbi:MAG: F0F1 ATP synthase subunit B [Bacteroidota bacterium]|nr:F0F1 ATP synthase subunit B [Bacteroidota bacterium]
MELITPGFGLLFWMIISFLIVWAILKKYAWKPILNALKNREKSIENALHSAEKVKAEMEKLQADNQKLLAEARVERDRILRDAREMKDRIIEEAKILAQTEGKKQIDAARESILNEKKAALKEIKDVVAVLSLQVAEKMLREKLSGEASQGEYIDKLLNEIKLN